MNTKNRWGTLYPYFYCLGRARKRTSCTQRSILIDRVEADVERFYTTVRQPRPPDDMHRPADAGTATGRPSGGPTVRSDP